MRVVEAMTDLGGLATLGTAIIIERHTGTVIPSLAL